MDSFRKAGVSLALATGVSVPNIINWVVWRAQTEDMCWLYADQKYVVPHDSPEPLSPKHSLSRCCPLVGSSSSKHSKNSKYSKNSKHSKYHEQRCGNPAPLAPKFSDFPPTHTR